MAPGFEGPVQLAVVCVANGSFVQLFTFCLCGRVATHAFPVLLGMAWACSPTRPRSPSVTTDTPCTCGHITGERAPF